MTVNTKKWTEKMIKKKKIILMIMLLVILIVLIIVRRHSVITVIKTTKSRAASTLKNVTFTKVLSLLAQNAATPPSYPVNETCSPKPLPR